MSFLPLLLCAQTDPEKVLGWNNTKWGMSETQVLHAVRQARKVNEKREMSTSFKPTLYIFARIDSLPFGGVPFRIDFLMDSATRTLASVESGFEGDSAYVNQKFAQLGETLTKKFGAPVSKNITENKTIWWLWNFPRTKIYFTQAISKIHGKKKLMVSYHVNAPMGVLLKHGK